MGRVTVKTIDKGRAEKKALTRPRNKRFIQLKTTLERYQDVFSRLHFPITISKENILTKPKLSEFVTNFLPTGDELLIGIAPFAAHESKMYRLELMGEVADKLINNGNYKVLLFGGGKNEAAQLESFAVKFPRKVESVAGKLTFADELALISRLNVMVAMDSGNGHLAANYGVPVITIWGVTHPFAGFVPFNQPLENQIMPSREEYPLIPTSVYGNSYPKGYEAAIDSIEPQSIVNRVLQVLQSDSASNSVRT